MKQLLIISTVICLSGFASAGDDSFAESISGKYRVVSCEDHSPVKGSAGYLCDSKTVYIGELPADQSIGARFIDVDYVIFNAKCGAPVICTETGIYAERQKPEFPGQSLITDIKFAPQGDGKLNIHFGRRLVPKLSDTDLDADVKMIVEKQN